MIYLIMAMPIEAKPIIDFFNLKKSSVITKFQVFSNDNITLLISGVGPFKSCIATTFFLSHFELKKDDYIINLGIAGCKSKKESIGDIFLCNRLKNNSSQRFFYPDMIFNHPFKEASLESFSTPIYSGENLSLDLIDMEGAAIFEAANYFVENHQIFILKIISDFLNSVDSSSIESLIKKNLPILTDFFSFLIEKTPSETPFFTKKEENLIEKTILKLNLTKSMQVKFFDLIKFYKLNGFDLNPLLNPLLNREIKNKKEVKEIFYELEQTIIKQ